MAFAFKRKESISNAIARLGRVCAEKALQSCEKEELEAIHSARKQIKKLRAVLRLVKQEIGKKAFEERLEELRKAAEYLARVRDAHVKAQALEKLARSQRKGPSAVKFVKLRAVLRSECAEEVRRFRKEKHRKEVQRILRKQPARFAKLRIKCDGWAAVGPGLKKSYRKARESRDVAQLDSSPENLHTWRKRVKDLWYNTQLLKPIWPEQMSAAADELEKLGEFLGDDHDLVILRQTAIRKSIVPDLETEVNALLGLIDARRAELQKPAFEMGARFFEEKPSDFCERLHRYWKLWKAKKAKRKNSLKQSRNGHVLV